ncbi:MAG: hypothetical protein ABFR02_00900 [Campylobacterota bacterium]
MSFDKDKLSNAWKKLSFESYKKQRNVYLAGAIITGGLFFMLSTGYYILNGVENSNSREMAIDERIDKCYKEKGLD